MIVRGGQSDAEALRRLLKKNYLLMSFVVQVFANPY